MVVEFVECPLDTSELKELLHIVKQQCDAVDGGHHVFRIFQGHPSAVPQLTCNKDGQGNTIDDRPRQPLP